MSLGETKLAPGESRCASCRAVILWVQMVRTDPDGTVRRDADGRAELGRRMPLDASPVLVGGTVVRARRGDGPWYGRMGTEEEKAKGVAMYRTHWASCPSADSHRRDKGIHSIHEDGGK